MGAAAAVFVARRMRSLMAGRGAARMIFASAPSQVEFLDALAAEPGSRLVAGHRLSHG